MIWKRLKKATPEQEREFRERLSEEAPLVDKVIMVFTCFGVVIIPAALVLIGFGLLILWMFGAL